MGGGLVHAAQTVREERRGIRVERCFVARPQLGEHAVDAVGRGAHEDGRIDARGGGDERVYAFERVEVEHHDVGAVERARVERSGIDDDDVRERSELARARGSALPGDRRAPANRERVGRVLQVLSTFASPRARVQIFIWEGTKRPRRCGTREGPMVRETSPIRSLDAWRACSTAERIAFAARVAAALDGFVPGLELVGRAQLAEVRHEATQTRFVVVPGGQFDMGFRTEEMREALRLVGLAPGTPGAEHWIPVFERIYRQASPVHRVRVGPFLCARAPVPDPLARELDPRMIGRCTLTPDVEAEVDEEAEEDEPDSVDSAELSLDERRLERPALLTPDEAARLRDWLDWRLLAESEWEYIAREGGSLSWIGSARARYREIATAISDLAAHPEFRENRWTRDTTNAFGVWGLAFGEWIADSWHTDYADAPAEAVPWGEPPKPEAWRGGAVLRWPWQDSAEVVGCHCACRGGNAKPDTLRATRFAIDLPHKL